jgi:hypothetical protein
MRKYYISILLSLLPLTPGAQNLMNPDGMTVLARFNVPAGYERIPSEAGTFASFLHTLPIMPNGSSVKYYSASVRPDNKHHAAAVIDMDIADKVQQAPQSVMRLWAEYLFEQQQFSGIHFHIRNGKPIPYNEWAQGMKIVVDRIAYWTQTPNSPQQYRTFRRYLDFIFKHSDFQTLANDLVAIAINDIAPGDILFHNGENPQVVMVIDVAINTKDNKKVVLLAQGGAPAQSIEILHSTADNKTFGAWFPVEADGTVKTGTFTFSAANFYRFRK